MSLHPHVKSAFMESLVLVQGQAMAAAALTKASVQYETSQLGELQKKLCEANDRANEAAQNAVKEAAKAKGYKNALLKLHDIFQNPRRYSDTWGLSAADAARLIEKMLAAVDAGREEV